MLDSFVQATDTIGQSLQIEVFGVSAGNRHRRVKKEVGFVTILNGDGVFHSSIWVPS